MSPFELPSGSNWEVEPKTRCSPSAERSLGDEAVGFGAGPGSAEPAMPWTSSPFGRWTGMPVEPSAKQGEQISGPPKAKVSRPASASRRVEEKGAVRGGGVGGDADVFGGPAVFAAGGEVGVDAAVGGVAGAGDAAVVDAVEDRGLRLRGSRRRESGLRSGWTRRHSRRRWRRRRARRRGSRGAGRRRSAGGRGRWGRVGEWREGRVVKV